MRPDSREVPAFHNLSVAGKTAWGEGGRVVFRGGVGKQVVWGGTGEKGTFPSVPRALTASNHAAKSRVRMFSKNSAKSGIRASATIITRTLALRSSGTRRPGPRLLARADASP